jgi:hypothetical protein
MVAPVAVILDYQNPIEGLGEIIILQSGIKTGNTYTRKL